VAIRYAHNIPYFRASDSFMTFCTLILIYIYIDIYIGRTLLNQASLVQDTVTGKINEASRLVINLFNSFRHIHFTLLFVLTSSRIISLPSHVLSMEQMLIRYQSIVVTFDVEGGACIWSACI